MPEFRVGQKVTICDRSPISTTHVIRVAGKRVTLADGTVWKQGKGTGWGADNWSIMSIRETVPEDFPRIRRRRLVKQITEFNSWDKLPTEHLESIVASIIEGNACTASSV